MKPLKILIVEDEVLTVMNLCKTLESNGHIVTSVARTLQEARESAFADPPNLALIDIGLEGSEGDGIDTSKMLSSRQAIPIIYLTANSSLDQFLKAQQTRPAAYLLKPFNDTELLFNIELAYHNFQPEIKKTPLEGYMMLPTNGALEMICLEEVLYLKAEGVYTQVMMANGIRHIISTGLKQVEQYFTNPYFFRLSRSYLINLYYIKQLKGNEVTLLDHQTRPTRLLIPDTNRKDLFSRFNIVRTKPRKGD